MYKYHCLNPIADIEFEKEVQTLTDKFIALINKSLEAKEAELKKV